MSECKHRWEKSMRTDGGGRCTYDEGERVECYRCKKCGETISIDEYKDAEIVRLKDALDEAQAIIKQFIPWLVRAKYNAMGKRAMTEDIRKKHIVQKDYIERKQGNEPYLCQSIHSVISVADVDALFAALDEAQGRVYPCADCGKMRTKDEGGTTFTVCDECWDKHYGKNDRV